MVNMGFNFAAGRLAKEAELCRLLAAQLSVAAEANAMLCQARRLESEMHGWPFASAMPTPAPPIMLHGRA